MLAASPEKSRRYTPCRSKSMAHPVDSAPAPPRPRMTFEEFLTSPYERAEWVDGEVFELSPENLDYQGVVGFLYPLLSDFVEQRELGQVFLNLLMKTGKRLAGRVPDILFLAKHHDQRLRRNYIDGPADLVVEVVSPDSMMRDRKIKRRDYEEGRVLCDRLPSMSRRALGRWRAVSPGAGGWSVAGLPEPASCPGGGSGGCGCWTSPGRGFSRYGAPGGSTSGSPRRVPFRSTLG